MYSENGEKLLDSDYTDKDKTYESPFSGNTDSTGSERIDHMLYISASL